MGSSFPGAMMSFTKINGMCRSPGRDQSRGYAHPDCPSMFLNLIIAQLLPAMILYPWYFMKLHHRAGVGSRTCAMMIFHIQGR